MSYFNNLTLTTKGQEMLLSSNTNIDKTITFTNASLGSEKLLPEEIKGAAKIKNSWLKFPLNTVRIINDESNYFLRAEIAFTNTGITESKIMRELGIYAKFENEEEVLFAYSTTDDDGETIPKEDIVPATYKFTINTTISTETKISQTLNPKGFLTKEVIELLKYYIANIAVQRFKGALTAGQTVININSEGSLLTTLSKRLQLFIGGELYSEGTDYTVNVENNTIHLKDEFRFEEGTIFEVIDNLPPGYVKELLDEFFKKANDKELEVLKNLEAAQTKNIEAIKTLSKQISGFLDEKNVTITGNLDKKIEEFYLDLDTYIEKNKEKLKGKSLYQSWLDVGNIGSESDFVNAMKIKGDDGDPGRGIVSTTIREGEGRQRIITVLYTDDTTNELIVEDGKSAYEVWKSDGNSGTTGDFFKSLEGRGLEYSWRGTELGVRVKGDIEYTFVNLKGENGGIGATGGDGLPGKSNYELWLEQGNGGTITDYLNSLKPNFTSKFITKGLNGENIYAWFDSEGNMIGEYTAEKGDRGFQGKPGLNWDGTLPEYPEVPTNVPYGTIVEFGGTTPPVGWVYTSGQNLPKGKYPFLVGVLPHIPVPEEPSIFINGLNYVDRGIVSIDEIDFWQVESSDKNFKIIKRCKRPSDTNINNLRDLESMFNQTNTNENYSRLINDGVNSVEVYQDYLEITLVKQCYLHRFEYYHRTYPNKVNIQVKSGELWSTVEEVNFPKDSIPSSHNVELREYIVKNKILTNHFRIALDKTIDYNTWLKCGIYMGESLLQLTEIIQIPYEKDSEGRFKIIYVGEEISLENEGVYSYNFDNKSNGQIKFSLAAENKLPSYAKGVTVTAPQPLRLGYINKYNNEIDKWDLEKTHENKKGYYYSKNGDLKYIPKPTNYHIWDFKGNNWIEDTLLKEKAKKDLLDKYIELEIKKDKMLDLKLNTTSIVEEIEKIKKNLEELNG